MIVIVFVLAGDTGLVQTCASEPDKRTDLLYTFPLQWYRSGAAELIRQVAENLVVEQG